MRLSAPIYRLKQNAKRLARRDGIRLHEALDSIAAAEGYAEWSLLAARYSAALSPAELYGRLRSGDCVLVAARPGQGKTLLALSLATHAVRVGRRSAFFTLEYTDSDVVARLASIGFDPAEYPGNFSFDCSDAICADYIIGKTREVPSGTLIVIDYLQLLDQRRDPPPLSIQINLLKSHAVELGLVVVFVAQIARAFDSSSKPVPDLTDIRMPNPVDLTVFNKAVFVHDGKIMLQECPTAGRQLPTEFPRNDRFTG